MTETAWPALAAFMGPAAYLRQAFAVNPAPEAEFVAPALLMVAHRLFWPSVSRPLYAVYRH